MRVLFINPIGTKVSQRGLGINLSIATLASVLIGHGHTVSLYDMANHVGNSHIDNISTSLENYDPDVIGISILNAQYQNAVNVIRRLRQLTKAFIVVGGAEITAVGEKIFHDTDFCTDISVLGEGEQTFVDILACLQKDDYDSIKEVPGLILNDDGRLIRTSPAQILKDLNAYPPPNLDIFGIRRIKLYKVLASRGCPYNCSFCFNYLGRTWRCRSPYLVVNELKAAQKRYGFERFRFLDSTFNLRPDWVIELCAEIMKSDIFGLQWEALGVRADRMNKELAYRMAEAGCKRVAIGVETLADDVFKLINKGEKIDQIKAGVRIAAEYFDNVSVFVIIGLPNDTREKSLFTYKELKKLGPSQISFAIAVPYSGTSLKNWVEKNAIVLGDSYECFTRGADAFTSGVAFETKDFSKRERMEVFKILNTKEFRYISKSGIHRYLDPFSWIMDGMRYDMLHIHKHILSVFKHFISKIRLKIKTSMEDTSDLEIVYEKVPDGTWWIER